MARNLPVLAFALSAIVLSFLAGVIVVDRGLYPYPQLRDGMKTIRYVVEQLFGEPFYGNFAETLEAEGEVADIAGRRIGVLSDDAFAGGMVMSGGLNQFLDVCPGLGCLAVEIDGTGAIVRGVPFRPAEIMAADLTGGSFSREGGGNPPERTIRPIGVAPYADGDLLVTFQSIGDGGAFPFSMGVGRIAPDGAPRWFRFDFSHHWSLILPDGSALVPALDVATQELVATDGDDQVAVRCETGRPQIDYVQVIDGAGSVVRRFDFAAQLAASNWSMALFETINGCDPLHLNYIDVVGPDDAPEAGLAEGDLILSLRNISAVAVLDGRSGALKNLIRGDFAQQHAAQHLSGARLLMFDNWGGDTTGGPSRLLEIDAATGASRRIFPLNGAPVYSRVAGHLDISPDRRRAVVAFSNAGRAFEVDIETGQVLATIDGLHDLTQARGAPRSHRGRPVRGDIYSVEYVRPQRPDVAASPKEE